MKWLAGLLILAGCQEPLTFKAATLPLDKEAYVSPSFQYEGLFSILPLDGSITSGYGMRKHPITKRKQFHHGVDIRATRGTAVFTRMAGLVTYASKKGGYGKLIEINHGNGIITRYAHLHKIYTSVGQFVNMNEVIGEVGTTGRSTGPHLHYEIRVNGKSLDPGKFYLKAFKIQL